MRRPSTTPEVDLDLSVVVIILQLIFLEGVLSIDNAAVLGALVSHVPDDQPIAWPESLRQLGDRLQRFLGNKRTAALRLAFDNLGRAARGDTVLSDASLKPQLDGNAIIDRG